MNVDIGSMRVQKVIELEGHPAAAELIFPDCTSEMVARGRLSFGPRFIDPESDVLYFDFHSYVLRTGALNILVDTCNGEHNPGMTRPWELLVD